MLSVSALTRMVKQSCNNNCFYHVICFEFVASEDDLDMPSVSQPWPATCVMLEIILFHRFNCMLCAVIFCQIFKTNEAVGEKGANCVFLHFEKNADNLFLVFKQMC